MKVRFLLVSVVSTIAFVAVVAFSEGWRAVGRDVSDRVVISAPVQLLLYFGDRHLAANLETMRLASTGMAVNQETGKVDGLYLLRAHRVVAQLNPCHEDNYYLANAILAWGGGDEEANEILGAATDCRFWDFMPPFLYGFNLSFFQQKHDEASQYYERAAERSPENAVFLKRLAITTRAEEMDNESIALEYLKQEQAQMDGAELKQSLQKRIDRLDGVIALREAHRDFKADYDRPLTSIEELVELGYLESVPKDPLNIGYVLEAGQINMKRIKVPGVR